MNIIKAIVIKTNTTHEDSNYCLYPVSGDNSVFRFSEKELSGVSDFNHNCSFITKNGIPDVVKTCDLLESGNTVQSNDVTIRLKNTTQLDKFLSSNNISLLKNIVEFYTFVGTDSDSDSVGVFLDGTRTIESVEYTETELILKVKMSLSKQRNKKLSIELDEANYPYVSDSNKGKMAPLFFGSSDPLNNRYFKILQSVNQNDTLSVIDTVLFDEDKTYNPYSYKFPSIYDSLDANEARIQIEYAIDANDLITDVNTNYPDWFNGLFLFCTNGASEIQNTAREIIDYTLFGEIMPNTRVWIGVILRDYLSKMPKGNLTFNATDQAYFELHRISIKYLLSHYKILGFYDSVSGLEQQLNYDIYGRSNGDIEKIMSSSIEYDNVNNILDVNPRVFSNSELTSLLSYDCYPANRIDKMERLDFDDLGHTGYDVVFESEPGNVAEGLNCTSFSTATVNNTTGTTGSYFNATDRQTGTGHRWINCFNSIKASAIEINTVEVGYKVFFPILPDTYKFSKCYLGLNLKTTPSTTSAIMKMIAKCKVYLQQSQDIRTGGDGLIDVLNIDSIPDFYYFTDPNTGNYNFYYEEPNTTAGQHNIRGHKGFEIDVSNVKDIRNIVWVGIIVEVNITSPDFNIESIFEEACFIFEREQDISYVKFL